MHIILIRLTVLSLHFQAVVSLPRSRYWLTPPGTSLDLVWGGWSHPFPSVPVGSQGWVGVLEPCCAWKNQPGSCWGAERWADTPWHYPAEYCCSSSFLPAGLPATATGLNFTLRYFILPWRICLTLVTHLGENFSVSFFSLQATVPCSCLSVNLGLWCWQWSQGVEESWWSVAEPLVAWAGT